MDVVSGCSIILNEPLKLTKKNKLRPKLVEVSK
jgi:hypothetical protein